MDKPVLSKKVFGEVDIQNIDYENNALYVMEMVINNGSWEDFKSIIEYYGEEKIKKEIIHTKELGPKEVNFCCVLFKMDQKKFIYLTTKPAYPEPWDFSGA
jgi:hypothetical protein